jgi:hypothetical protein
VRLVGHEKEVGGVDWANNTVSFCLLVFFPTLRSLIRKPFGDT